VSPIKTAEPIEMLFGLWTQVGPRYHVLGGGPDHQWEEAILGVVPPFLLDYVSSKHLLQEQCHGESVASELAHPPQG